MSVRRDKRNGRWFFRKQVRCPDGRRVRIFGVPTIDGLPNSKAAAEEAERRAIQRVLDTGKPRLEPPKEVPTIKDFAPIYLATSRAHNKPSTMIAKEMLLRVHVLPRLGHLRLDQITYAVIEDFKLALVEKPIANEPCRKDGTSGTATKRRTLTKKSVNNVLTVVRRMLSIARKRGLIVAVPEIEWYRLPAPEFDFFTFDEADRLIAASPSREHDDWGTMILLALRTGLRLGELMALRWQDVDLIAGKLVVRQNVVRGIVGTPKSGRAREVPLGDEVLAALKRHRHLRGPLVFCNSLGGMHQQYTVRYALVRACKKAQLRIVGWHVLRHTFASHLAMRGAPLKAIQELLGHAMIQMTMRYAHLSPDVARDAVKLLDSVPRGSRTENREELTGNTRSRTGRSPVRGISGPRAASRGPRSGPRRPDRRAPSRADRRCSRRRRCRCRCARP